MKFFHLSGTASSGNIALTGHTDSHAPQSMHSSGWMKYMLSASVVYMQSTGHTSTHDASFTSMHGSVIMYAICDSFPRRFLWKNSRAEFPAYHRATWQVKSLSFHFPPM